MILVSKWDLRFLSMASMVSGWSKDPSTKVGAVIVDDRRRVISTGYNGFPQGIVDNERRLNNRQTKLSCTLHAEENALAFATQPVRGLTLYVTGHPCAHCAATLIQHGIARVVYSTKPDLERRWFDDMCLARDMFIEAGVVVQGSDDDGVIL